MADYPPKKNAAFIFYISLISQANTKIAQASPTLAAGDVKVAIDDAAPANPGTLPVVDADFTKRVKVELTAGEMNGDNISILFSDAAGSEWCDLMVNIQTVTRQLTDLAYPTVSGRSVDVSAGGEVGLDWANIGSPTTAQNLSATNIDVDQVVASVSGAVGSVGAGGITAASIATGAVDADALATDAVAEIAGGVWNEDATAHQTQGTFGQAIGDPVADTNTIFKAVVSDATGATVGVDVVAVKAETASLQTDTNDMQTRLPAALVSGRMDSSLGAIAAGVDLSATMKTSVKGEVVNALNVDTYAEPTGAPTATTTLVRKISYLYMALRNKLTVSATAKTFFDDGGASEWSKTLSDNGTTYTEDEGV